jgi:ADP-ribose pyrophosphatase YjhB (NUDIX family)
MTDLPPIQLIANLVIENDEGLVLYARDESQDERWWLPGADLEAYEHPDEAAARVIRALPGLEAERTTLSSIESFRGRRGWHVVFHYHVRASGTPREKSKAEWFPTDAPPPTAHGRWERDAVASVLTRLHRDRS